MNLFVIAGHGKQAPGAKAWDGSYEHSYTTMLQWYIAREHHVIQMEGTVMLDADDLSLTQVINHINKNAKRGDYGIDIHFNNNNIHATGVEGFVHPEDTKTNKRIATTIINETSRIVNIPVRRHHGYRDYKYPEESNIGKLAIIEDTNIPFFLYEGCFLNERDLPKFIAMMPKIARMIVDTYQENIKTF